MLNPFIIIIPQVLTHLLLFIRVRIFLFLPIFFRFRFNSLKNKIKGFIRALPRWLLRVNIRGGIRIIGVFFWLVGLRLIPFSLLCLHFPVFGVGLRVGAWLTIFLAATVNRSVQFKKEYLRDASLSVVWAVISVVLESLRRLARAITLGGRIRVNIMMGRILHVIAGQFRTRLGIVVLSFFELFVVLVQCYVFLLLLQLYLAELE